MANLSYHNLLTRYLPQQDVVTSRFDHNLLILGLWPVNRFVPGSRHFSPNFGLAPAPGHGRPKTPMAASGASDPGLRSDFTSGRIHRDGHSRGLRVTRRWIMKHRVAGEVALPWLSHHRTYGSRITAVPQEEELAKEFRVSSRLIRPMAANAFVGKAACMWEAPLLNHAPRPLWPLARTRASSRPSARRRR